MPTVGEVWRPAVGFSNYEVSNAGRVRAIARWRLCSDGKRKFYRMTVLKPWLAGPDKGKYLYVRLSGVNKRVNVLVIEAFGDAKPKGAECRHINGDRLDNSAGNLCWGTRKDNMEDMIRHGRSTAGERHPKAKVTEETVHYIRRLRSVGLSTVEIGKRVGLSQTHVSGICNRRYWRHI